MKRKYFRSKVRQQYKVYENRIFPNSSHNVNAEQNCVIHKEEEEHFEERRHFEESEEINLRQKLKVCYLETKPTRSCLEKLLAVLSEEGLEVPLTAAAFLGKKNTITLRKASPGCYCHLGIEKQLKKVEHILQDYEIIEVDINIDGIPLFKSSRTQLWPILIKVVNTKEKITPMPVGIFAGPSKPHCIEDYLKDFIEEANLLNGELRLSNKFFFLFF